MLLHKLLALAVFVLSYFASAAGKLPPALSWSSALSW
jgi:hypothetical protein